MIDEENTRSQTFGQRILKVLKSAIRQDDTGPYYHVALSNWGKLHDVEKLSEELRKDFTFVKTLLPERKRIVVISELKGPVPELEFKADTLFALIAPNRAVLFQKKRGPFTKKDVELRKTILELYPCKLNLPLFAREHTFEVQEPEPVLVKKARKRKGQKRKKQEE
ncbi:hypothetical protein AC480_02065 [miscellaneous Crenarchaeota group archaeon SMTZ1-55]|nr:MAG: hypothetical protein AC480_02065 [miscellaneous Crenarchaeota group archaeon SMTZ1-55]